MSECLANIIQLSEGIPCPGMTPDEPLVALSGVYLDKLPGLENILSGLLNSLKHGEDDIFELFDKCLEEACRMFQKDLIMCLKDRNQLRQEFRQTHIVGNKFDHRVTKLTKDYAVVSFFFSEIPCGRICFDEIGFLPFKNVSSKNLAVFDQYGCPITQWKIDIDDKKPSKLVFGNVNERQLPPFCIELDECKELHFVYENCGSDPKFNESWCGCRGKKPPYQGIVNIQGNQSNFNPHDTDSFLKLKQDVCPTPRNMYGMCFKFHLECDFDKMICDLKPGDERYLLIAYALAYKVTDLLLSRIIHSRKINYETLVDKEVLMGVRNHYRALYNSQMFGDKNVEGICSCFGDCACFKKTGFKGMKLYDAG